MYDVKYVYNVFLKYMYVSVKKMCVKVNICMKILLFLMVLLSLIIFWPFSQIMIRYTQNTILLLYVWCLRRLLPRCKVPVSQFHERRLLTVVRFRSVGSAIIVRCAAVVSQTRSANTGIVRSSVVTNHSSPGSDGQAERLMTGGRWSTRSYNYTGPLQTLHVKQE